MPDSPLSLFLISYSYPPVLGGSEVEAQRVCAALRQRGHNVTVLCSGMPPMPKTSRWTDPYGVPVRIFASGWNWPIRDLLFGLGVAWTLWKERRNYQQAYFLMQGFHLAVGLPVARLLRKPVVMKVSGSNLITMMRRSISGRFELRCLQRWAYRVMILNSGMEEEALAAGFDKHKLFWMPNPVDTTNFAPVSAAERRSVRQQFGIPLDARVVLFVGRLAPEKELPSLLSAFARTIACVPDAILVLVGDGPERENLERTVESLGIAERVLFAGRQPAEKVVSWLQLADVFALVSSIEGFSCSLLEAMSVGLPSVVSAIPANTQLIAPGVHGLQAPAGDAESLSACLVQLLLNEPLRASMAHAARKLVLENYSIDQVIDRYEVLFRDALAGR
ncbi:MAG TPA: glycosyltransferase family 4 protein [Bryobacteraceae bacterium]|nr:glycosyltransferase family 4 protein [Bryobacteraceae bacterium]